MTSCDLCARPLGDESVIHVKDGFEIARCGACGLVQRRTRPEAAQLSVIYGREYFTAEGVDDLAGQGYDDYLADAELHRLQAQRRLALVERHVRPGALLDVGAAAGFFVAEATRRGWDARGIDVAAEMVAWGREHLDARLEVGLFGDEPVAPESLAALTMWDYLEHSISPRQDLARAASLVQHGGLLALSTGDAGSLAARLSGSRWHLLTPRHHNFFFTRTTLRRYLAGAGFDVVFEGHPGGRYQVRYLAHKAQTLIPTEAAADLMSRLARSKIAALTVPVNLRDIITVLARRDSRSHGRDAPRRSL